MKNSFATMMAILVFAAQGIATSFFFRVGLGEADHQGDGPAQQTTDEVGSG